ncbi:MAG: DUF3667 domain-containing protein [Hyphomonas sp.]|uniref:DUF3667 domain-containing protein n=1 Tax=Hyphomonas sp. TaxID=87 RepID=UPI003527F618
MDTDLGSGLDTAIEHAGADAAAGAGKPGGPVTDTNCLNCGEPLAGEFCHACGQSAHSVRRPFWALFAESLETLFSIDGRIARTLPDLLLKPGKMTRAYLDGQRARFIPPFRLYVLASLVFFVAMPLLMGHGLSFLTGTKTADFDEARAEIERAHDAGDMTDEAYEVALESVAAAEDGWKEGIPGLVTPDQPEGEADATGETAETLPGGEWEGPIPKEAADAIREASANGNKDAARLQKVIDNPEELGEQTMRWIPRLMFVMLPVYAALLALTYLWRSQFLYFDHLIVSLHFHSALFFAMALGGALSPLIGLGWVIFLLIIYSNWYLYRMNRVVYGRGAITSILRVMTLDTVYFCALMSGLLLAVILGALSL